MAVNYTLLLYCSNYRSKLYYIFGIFMLCILYIYDVCSYLICTNKIQNSSSKLLISFIPYGFTMQFYHGITMKVYHGITMKFYHGKLAQLPW